MARIKIAARLLPVLLLALLAVLPLPAHAQNDRERQLVYNGETFDGQGYGGQFYPANESTIYLLADAQNGLIPRLAEVYLWPVTHQYKADWETLYQPVTCTLEIGNKSFPLTTYSLRHDSGYSNAQTTLLIGGDAAAAYADSQKAQADYQAAAAAYNDAWNKF